MLVGDPPEDQVKVKSIKMNYDTPDCYLIVTPKDSCIERDSSSSIVMLRGDEPLMGGV